MSATYISLDILLLFLFLIEIHTKSTISQWNELSPIIISSHLPRISHKFLQIK